MINVMCIFIFVNWDTLVPWAYQLCCLPSINNTIQYKDDMILEGQDEKNMVALMTFYRLWNENFPNVIIPEVCYIIIVLSLPSYIN